MAIKKLNEQVKKALVEKFVGQELTDEVKAQMKEEVAKALTAGYDVEEPAEELKQVDPGPTLTQTPEVKAKVEETAPEAPKVEETPAPVAKQPSFGKNLFQPFTLGATLKPQPHGNVMTNMKQPAMDYVAEERKAIRQETYTLNDKGQPVKKG